MCDGYLARIMNRPAYDIHPIVGQCWASVADGEPTFTQHWLSVFCLWGSSVSTRKETIPNAGLMLGHGLQRWPAIKLLVVFQAWITPLPPPPSCRRVPILYGECRWLSGGDDDLSPPGSQCLGKIRDSRVASAGCPDPRPEWDVTPATGVHSAPPSAQLLTLTTLN